jgi:DNA-binding beta-propeller fold protein YncE
VIGAGLVLIALLRLLPITSSSPSALHASAPATSPPVPAALPQIAETRIATTRVLGAAAGLRAPQEAVQLPNGDIAVADTGNNRLAILDSHGHRVRVVTSSNSPLQQPFALAAGGSSLYVLDSQRGAIEVFDMLGRFQRQLIAGPTLVKARGLARGPDGLLYAANPSSNSLIVVSPRGTITRTITTVPGSGRGELNQPSDIALGLDGTVYVMDNVNNRITAMRPIGAPTDERPAPASTTVTSVHVLALSDGRLLASDPSGSLLLYPRGAGAPIRILLRLPGQGGTGITPLGLSLLGNGKVLVTDSGGNRLLVLGVPR